MSPRKRILSLLAALSACAALPGCGGADEGEPIPQGDAALLERQLDAVVAAVEGGQCDRVGPAVNRLQTTIAALDSSGVGDDVQDALGDGADNLRGLATSECEPEDEEPVETVPETTPVPTPPPPEPTVTTPPPTTTTEEPTPAPEPEPEPEPAPDEDGGGVRVPPGQAKQEEDG